MRRVSVQEEAGLVCSWPLRCHNAGARVPLSGIISTRMVITLYIIVVLAVVQRFFGLESFNLLITAEVLVVGGF